MRKSEYDHHFGLGWKQQKQKIENLLNLADALQGPPHFSIIAFDMR